MYDEISKGRKVLVYIQNSNTTDISPRLAKMMEDKGYRVKVLKCRLLNMLADAKRQQGLRSRNLNWIK